MSTPLVLILMGSDSDWEVMSEARKALDDLGIASEVHVSSAHRTPERTGKLAREAAGRGVQVIICGAGAAAHLAGVCAAETELPGAGRAAGGERPQGPRRAPRHRADAGRRAGGHARHRQGRRAQRRAPRRAHRRPRRPVVAERVRAQRRRMAEEVEAKDAALQAKLAPKG